MPEINATSQQIDALLQKLASVLASSEDREILARMTQANTGLPVRFVRKPATSTKSYTGRVVRVGIASGFRSVG